MADFSINSTNLASPQGAGSAPVAPVEQRAINTSPLDFISTAVESAFKYIGNSQKADKEALKDQALKSYADEQSTINKLSATGYMSPSEAKARSQDAYNRSVAAYPSLHADLTALHKGFAGASQLEDVLDEEKFKATARQDLIKKAMGDGVPIRTDMDKPTQDKMLDAYQAQQRSKEELSAYMRAEEFKRGQTTYQQGQDDRRAKEQTIGILNKITSSQIGITDAVVLDWANTVKNDPSKYDEVKVGVTSYFTKLRSVVQAASANNPELAPAYRTMFDDLQSTAEKLIDPKTRTDQLENQWKQMVNTALINMGITDPVVIKLSAMTQALGPNSTVAMQAASPAINAFIKMVNPPVASEPAPYVLGKDMQGDIVKMLKNHLDGVNKQTYFKDPEKARTELKIGMDNLMKQTSAALDGGMSSKDVADVMSLMASPEFGKYIKEGTVSPDAVAAMSKTVQLRYNKDIIEAVDNKLGEYLYGGAAFGKGSSSAPVKKLMDVVEVQFNGSGVSFVPKKGVNLDKAESRSQAESLKLLSDASVGVNRMLHLAAHLSGTTDYAATWEANKHILMPQMYPVKKGSIVNGYEFIGNDASQWDNKAFWKQLDKPTGK